jgi:D-alanyl-D-alanine endopeptidase (penicillin-binding protein 7)
MSILPSNNSSAAQSQKETAGKAAKTKQTAKKQSDGKTKKTKASATKQTSKKTLAAQKAGVKSSSAKTASVKKASTAKYGAKKTGSGKYSSKKSASVKSSSKSARLRSGSTKTAKTRVVHGKHLAAKQPEYYTPRHTAPVRFSYGSDGRIHLHSAFALVQDQASGKVLYEKRADEAVPIASITKLMTAMVALDAAPSLTETMTISQQDVDMLRHSRSRLPVGASLSREEMLRLALMSSENRAASALARYYPGGKSAFIEAMNNKALALGMFDTYFYDSTGLNAGNVSSARDLARMVAAAGEYPLIRQMTSTATHDVQVGRRLQRFNNTNALVKNPDWTIEVSKTGYINEAGKCIVMKTWINSKPTVIVLLDSAGSSTRIADSMRIKSWLESPAYLTSRDVSATMPPGGFE